MCIMPIANLIAQTALLCQKDKKRRGGNAASLFVDRPAAQATEPPAFSIFPRPAPRASCGADPNRPYSTLPRLFARIRKTDADSTISQPRYGRNQPPLNHDSTILRVEYKNDTISTKPSYFSDSPTPTDTQKQFNLNQKTGARSSVQSPLQAK